MKKQSVKKSVSAKSTKAANENTKKNLVGIRPSPKMRKQLKATKEKLDSKKNEVLKKNEKLIVEASSLEEYLDKNYGKVGTIKRAMNEKLIVEASLKLNQKQFTNSDMVIVYNEAQALALKTKKYTGISGYKKIIEKITKNNKK